jgi:hypothetical protein
MINDTPAGFIFIRACILFLDSIFPFAFLYCALVAVSKGAPFLSRLNCLPVPVLAWLTWEVLFHFFIFRPRFDSLQRDAVHPELASRAEREKLFDRCNQNIPDPEAYLSNWFGGREKDEIKRENVKEFLRWAFLNSRDIREEYEEEIEMYTKKTEEMLGRPIPDGRGSAKSLRLTLDKIRFGHRSFLWYMVLHSRFPYGRGANPLVVRRCRRRHSVFKAMVARLSTTLPVQHGILQAVPIPANLVAILI